MELAAGWADEKQLFTYLDLEQDGESGAFAALLLVFICVVSGSYRLIHQVDAWDIDLFGQ